MQLEDKTTRLKDHLRIIKKINTRGSLNVIWFGI